MNYFGSFFKYVIFLLNLALILCGSLLILFGVLTIKGVGNYKEFLREAENLSMPVLTVLLGTTIFVVAFIGCCGACCENFFCTAIFAALTFIVTIIQISLVVWAFTNRQHFLNSMQKIVVRAWKERKTVYRLKFDNDKTMPRAMEAIEITFSCCGRTGYKDYGDALIPKSCCGYPTTSEQECEESAVLKRLGCEQAFMSFWSNNIDIVRWVGMVIALVLGVVFVFAVILAKNIRATRKHTHTFNK